MRTATETGRGFAHSTDQGSFPRKDSALLGAESKFSRSETTKTLKKKVQIRMRRETEIQNIRKKTAIFFKMHKNKRGSSVELEKLSKLSLFPEQSSRKQISHKKIEK